MNGARAIFTHNSLVRVSPLIPPRLEGLGSAILRHACREMDGEIWQTVLMAAQGVIECYHPCSSFKSACLEGGCKLGKTCSPPTWISWLKIEHLTCPNKVTWLSYSVFEKSRVSWRAARKRQVPHVSNWIRAKGVRKVSSLSAWSHLFCMKTRESPDFDMGHLLHDD